MSESIVRKIQPFTIGTKLSVPSVPKCPDFAESYLPSQTLDNCKMQHNLNDQVSLYLGQSQMHPSTSQFSPVAARVMQVERRPEEMVEEDHLNRNAVSPTSASRSIKKITISGSTEAPGDRGATVAHCTKVAPVSKTENINNNNNIAFKPLPRIVGVTCENKPNSQFKVFLRKEADLDTGSKERSNGGSSGLQSLREKTPSICQNAEPRAVLPRKESLKMEIQSYGHVETPSSERVHTQQNECSLTQLNAQFNREILQAEAWIKGKLRDLKDGCSVQRCPLQDWEEVAQTLQRDLKDFENTLIQLNQMGEQLICRQNPTADQVKKQLSQLKDQWHLLRQTAGNQSKALSGARNLQEFNRKVDKLEVWIKAKQEEDQSLAKVLGQNIDKLQLTRKILDLKQDEQLYRTLHEEINSLALKLEKLGKNESKNISARRKHINKMWLKVQTLLKDFHEKLQLALELSSFYQQADNVIRAINNKRKSISSSSDQENSTDREIRDIASHIMMLDVTASQLSNLHPALATRVTQKQGEVKDGWALLQKAVRNEKAGLQSSCLVFTREDGDPLTPARGPQCSVGTEVHRIMGKEVKEEQNRLKGCVNEKIISHDHWQMAQQKGSRSIVVHKSHVFSVAVFQTLKVQPAIQDHTRKIKKHKTESHTAFSRGNSQLQVQLQKFTVSADKTLSWLKDNVAMATQLCCAVGPDGFEEARRCQAALEEDILSNRARIEVVQKEGRSLVRAQHPGSAKIEEFLGQLDVLWEELKKRHQKNAVVLQESEKLDLKAQKVLKDLSSLEAWLQMVESSIRQSSLEGDPESVSAAERESSLLEREVASRGLELRVLRQEVDKLSGRRHVHTQQLPRRMDEVEEKYRSVQEALKQQTSELQDTRMLTEFLERVELEECLEPKRMSSVDCNEQAHGSELRANSSLLQLSDPASQLIDSIADPVEELREAVEMLNDTVRERGRSLIRNQDQGIKELLSQHSALTVRINGKLSRSLELHVDIHEMETEMAVKCEPDQCGLEDLEDQQEDLEIDYEIIKEEVDEMEKLAAQLEELCPEKMQVLSEEVRSTLHVWEELGKSLSENRARLRQFLQLQDFFRNYLAMISWTEDTRACIFSDTTVHPGKGNQMPVIAELDKKIEQKFAEFDDLAAAGQKLIDEEHHLTEMAKRTEELRSMLGWILVRWRAQKHQRSCGKRKEEPKGDVIYSEATICSPQQHQSPSPQSELPLMAKAHFKGGQRQADFEACSGPDGSSTHGDAVSEQQPEACYEVMAQIGQKKKDSPESPFLVLKEPSAPSLGGTVNLILSFGKKGDSQLQVQDTVEEGETQEPVHRVSTYLHVKDSHKAMTPVYESVTLPHLSSKEQPQPSTSSMCSVSSVSFHTLPKITSNSLFSSLKRRNKKKKRDVRRHTIQKIMGVSQADVRPLEDNPITYNTNTWPLKERTKGSTDPNPVNGQVLDYVKNPLVKDIDAECTSVSNFAHLTSKRSTHLNKDGSTPHVKNNCRHVSLGSVLSFELPKDLSLISNIPDLITIAPQEQKRTGDLSSSNTLSVLPQLSEKHKQEYDSATNSQFISGGDISDIKLGQISDLLKKAGHDWEEQVSALDSPENLHSANQTTDILKGENHLKPKGSDCHSEPGGNACQVLIKKPGITDISGISPTATPHVAKDQNTVIKDGEDLVDSSTCNIGRIKVCARQRMEAADVSLPRKAVGRPYSFAEAEGVACNGDLSSCEAGAGAGAGAREEAMGVIHPDHQQFEEEEEELEDIWNKTNSYRQSICSDIMYQTHKEELTGSPSTCEEESDSRGQDVLYRKLITASAPNLLVAEFRLPASIQTLLGYNKEQSAGEKSPDRGNRRSWAAFPQQASDMVKLPDVEDQQKYIYQYREEEEEVEDTVSCFDFNTHEHLTTPQDQSVSLLSVHMGLEGHGNQLTSMSPECDRAEQGHISTTGGLCSTVNGKNPEFQSMAGTLERKHKLQLGGKKASCRAWNTYHAVLFKQTLCFYQDRKDTLKSAVAGLPLNLTGAECTPAPEYTKKANCFSLRLRDGSEYLLSASSRFLMKKWILKIQANTGIRRTQKLPGLADHAQNNCALLTMSLLTSIVSLYS
ncbi:SPTN5 protein, partial [Atractosteus spatula]|nr:SPTN5 protein [Atractosteus spatula]